jgi:hypothetical protein
MPPSALFTKARKRFHKSLLEKGILNMNKDGVASNADKHSSGSVAIAREIVEFIGEASKGERLAGQTAGNNFEEVCTAFLTETFSKLAHLRPGKWQIQKVSGRSRSHIAEFEQYTHLVALEAAAKKDPQLAAALGSDYTITPDIVIARETEPDEEINRPAPLVDEDFVRLASLRRANGGKTLLHASISCKWTIRSDRAQNSRTEAQNLIRNRKGRLPHVVVVTGEPLPGRIASIALGTGDVDCVYHFALPELTRAVEGLQYSDSVEILNTMVNGKRLKDISDLPLDLAI